MATATSSRGARRARRPIWAAAAAALVVTAVVIATAPARPGAPAHATSAFSWLNPSAPAAGWRTGATASGARLAFPVGWRTIATDHGTVSAAPAGPRGAFAGYLNATPQGGDETLANWSRFRPAHNADEGSRHIHLVAARANLAFRGGHGSCVMDDYSTSATRFREIACIVAGTHGTNVVVAAAPVARWTAQAPLLERAVSAFTA